MAQEVGRIRPRRPEDDRVRSSRTRRAQPWDAVTALSVFVFLLFAIPSKLVFGPLGGAGSPAQLLGMGLLLWWISWQLTRPGSRRAGAPRPTQPVRRAMLLFAAAVLASYVAATVRPIDGVEMRAADRGLLMLLSWLGVVFVAADGIPSMARLEVLLRRLVVAGGAISVLGVAQFQTGRSFVDLIQIPGLSVNSSVANVLGRDGFARPAGTAMHPIEHSIVLTMILPIAIHLAMSDTHRSRLRRWFPVAALAVAVPISISRSAIVCTVVVLSFLLPTFSRTVRRRAYAGIAVLLGVMFVAVPGILGALAGLFSGISGDTSAQSRTGSYGLAWDFIARAPVVGRGFQTFLPEYRILDNQFLLSAIDIGFVGMLALLALFVTGVVTALRSRHRSGDPRTRSLAQALGASVAAGMASFALFDALSFPQVACLVMLVIGMVGAVHRLQLSGEASVGGEPGRAARLGRTGDGRLLP